MIRNRLAARLLVICAVLGALAAQPPTLAQGKPADVVYVTRTGDKYHRDGCRHLAKSKIKTTRGEAEKTGKQACKVCRP